MSICVFGYIYLGDGDTDRRESLHDGRFIIRTKSLPFVGDISPEVTKCETEKGRAVRLLGL